MLQTKQKILWQQVIRPPYNSSGQKRLVRLRASINYKIDFGGKLFEEAEIRKYQEPLHPILADPEIIEVNKRQYIRKRKKEQVSSSEKWFKLLWIIIAVLFMLSWLGLAKNEETFLTMNFIIGFVISFWFLLDYKMLRINKLYIKSFGFSIAIFLYGYFLSNEFWQVNESGTVLLGTFMPLFFLTIQRPLRFLFIWTLKREPVVEKPAPSFADLIYTFILTISHTALVIFYVES